MNEKLKNKIIEHLELNNVTKSDDGNIGSIADEFPNEYGNEHEYVQFQMDIGNLVEELKVKFVEKNVGTKELSKWLTGTKEQTAGLYRDGSFAVDVKVGIESTGDDGFGEDERPISIVRCLGTNNMDSGTEYFTCDWTKQDSGNLSEYIVTKKSENYNVGDKIALTDCIEECCEYGDVEDELISFREKLVENYLEKHQSKDLKMKKQYYKNINTKKIITESAYMELIRKEAKDMNISEQEAMETDTDFLYCDENGNSLNADGELSSDYN